MSQLFLTTSLTTQANTQSDILPSALGTGHPTYTTSDGGDPMDLQAPSGSGNTVKRTHQDPMFQKDIEKLEEPTKRGGGSCASETAGWGGPYTGCNQHMELPTRRTTGDMPQVSPRRDGSGWMAAINNVMNLVSPGDHIVSFDDVYGGTRRLFKSLMIPKGYEVTYVDATDLKKLQKEIRPTTKLVWLESPSNPTMKLVDIKGACEIVRKKCCAILVVDNTFMSSYFQKPIDLGAHISVHSLTKYMNGHSDVVMGAVITNDKKIYDRLRFFQNAAGAVPSPFDCFLANRGLKTLPVRMERHMENGLKVAKFLASHPLVEKVIHPGLPSHPQHELAVRQSSGFSGMVSFYIKGGLTESTNFLKSTKIIALASSLGGIESLSELPTVMSHASVKEEVKKAIGITDNLIRLSIGIEHIDDLLNDICQALHKAISYDDDLKCTTCVVQASMSYKSYAVELASEQHSFQTYASNEQGAEIQLIMAFEQWHFNTNAVHAGQDPSQWNSRAVVPPISMATTFQQGAPAEHYVELSGFDWVEPVRRTFELFTRFDRFDFVDSVARP
ncbi:hypothetical protein HPB47_023138 [Ixodes persulcatus]|uniref:Uncharacterized protein n=1 Tax=Ixodes persulcatus TaxID=34615 RepID=A0AC60QB59_IXOPE|nr:hypothetical protein HPB47_023138 [Ixodes persulcatus]